MLVQNKRNGEFNCELLRNYIAVRYIIIIVRYVLTLLICMSEILRVDRKVMFNNFLSNQAYLIFGVRK
jgi:hypothetical protein